MGEERGDDIVLKTRGSAAGAERGEEDTIPGSQEVILSGHRVGRKKKKLGASVDIVLKDKDPSSWVQLGEGSALRTFEGLRWKKKLDLFTVLLAKSQKNVMTQSCDNKINIFFH